MSRPEQISATYVRSADGIVTVKKWMVEVRNNLPKAREYQGYIDELGPGEIDFGNGDTRAVYHPCDRQRNEQALDNIANFNRRNGITEYQPPRTSREARRNRRS